MPYTFDASTNTIYVCPYRGIKVTNIYTKHMQDARKTNPCKSAEWTKGQLVMGDGGEIKYYDVYIAKERSSPGGHYAILLKVVKKYNDGVFEEVFGLGCECRGWISDLTVKITN